MKILDILCAFVFLVVAVGGLVVLLGTPLEDSNYFYIIFVTMAAAVGFWGFVSFVDRLLESKSKKGNPGVSDREKC